MEIVYDDEQLRDLHRARPPRSAADHPVLVDRFLDDAIEIDVDALFDGDELYLGGVMEHIEEAGIHSGDSACVLPPITLGRDEIDRGPRADRGASPAASACAACSTCSSRWPPTCSTCSRPTRGPVADRAVRLQGDRRCRWPRPPPGSCSARPSPSCGPRACCPPHGDGGDAAASDAPVAVKEAVLPFKRFRTVEGRGVDNVLGPEMRSTGEVMGIDADFGTAFAKSQARPTAGCRPRAASSSRSPTATSGTMIFPVKRLADLGFEILATEGTAEVLRRNGVEATVVRKHSDGRGPDGEPTIVERILAGEVDLVVNTPSGPRARGSTATRSARPRSRWTGRSSPRSRSWRPPCRASRRSAAATLGVRSLQDCDRGPARGDGGTPR